MWQLNFIQLTFLRMFQKYGENAKGSTTNTTPIFDAELENLAIFLRYVAIFQNRAIWAFFQ